MLRKCIKEIGIILQDVLKEIGFKCQNCGECCEVGDYYPIENIQYITRLLWIGETDTIPRKGWELFPKEAIIPECWAGKLKLVKKKGIITCFYHDPDTKKCSIYENRPILCKGYPLYIKHDGDISVNERCKGMVESGLFIKDIMEAASFKKLFPLLARLKDDIKKVTPNFSIKKSVTKL